MVRSPVPHLYNRWRLFGKVQPLQLTLARAALAADGTIVVERSAHTHPVVTLRLPYPEGRQREIERLRGARSKQYRKYLSWTNDQQLCGHHAETVVLDSLRDAASPAGLFVPDQQTGRITGIKGHSITPGPLDAIAYILDVPDLEGPAVPMLIEVKNITNWIYPNTSELWELLVKAADVATSHTVLPLLVCTNVGYPTFNMAKDIGFFVTYTGKQLFSPNIDQTEFQSLVDEFDLAIMQHEGPYPTITGFLAKTLRRSPPPSPPFDEVVPWYTRQVARFQAIAPTILRFAQLAAELDGPTRTNTFTAFKAAVADAATWELVRGW